MCVGYTLIYAILYKGPGTNPQRMQRDDCINFSKVVMVCVCMPKKKGSRWVTPRKLFLFACPFLCFSNFLHRGCVSLEIEGEALLNSKTNHFSCINL